MGRFLVIPYLLYFRFYGRRQLAQIDPPVGIPPWYAHHFSTFLLPGARNRARHGSKEKVKKISKQIQSEEWLLLVKLCPQRLPSQTQVEHQLQLSGYTPVECIHNLGKNSVTLGCWKKEMSVFNKVDSLSVIDQTNCKINMVIEGVIHYLLELPFIAD